MQLNLVRQWPNNTCQIGLLAIDGVQNCYTIERSEDDPDFKPIPLGTFPINVRWSDKFQRILPHIDKVPGRTAIEIHVGNWAKDTEGCVCVGKYRESDTMIGQSEVALNALIAVLKPAQDRGEAIYITIEAGNAEWPKA